MVCSVSSAAPTQWKQAPISFLSFAYRLHLSWLNFRETDILFEHEDDSYRYLSGNTTFLL